MSDDNKHVDPSLIMQLSTAYWDSQVFLTANRIGLFECLSQQYKTVDEVAQSLSLKTRPTKLMLNVCVALGLLQKQNEEYSNREVTEKFLVPGQPTFMGNAVAYSDDLYETWGKLEQCLREDQPMLASVDYLGKDSERTKHFVYGMHNKAMGTANALANLVDLEGKKQLLDVGGGPGTFSCLLAESYPDLQSRVMDLPDIVKHAKDIIASMGKQQRVKTYPGDYHVNDFPKENDVVLISGVFHRETETACKALIKKAYGSLISGGVLIISDVFTDEGGISPTFSTLFSINMLLTAENGGIHEDAKVSEWMKDAGFLDMNSKSFPPPMPHRLIMGVKL